MGTSINYLCFSSALMVLAVLNPLEWVFCDSPQFIRGRCLDETDDETPICCIRSQRFKTPTRLGLKWVALCYPVIRKRKCKLLRRWKRHAFSV